MTDYLSERKKSARREKFPMGLVAVVGCIAVIGLGALVLMSFKSPLPDPKAPSRAQSKSAAPAAKGKRIKAEDLYAQYEAGAAKADAAFKGKLLDVDGVVEQIAATEKNEPLVVLRAKEWQPAVECVFEEDRRAQLAPVKLGDRIVVEGRCGGLPASGEGPRLVRLSKCRVVSRRAE